MLYQHRLMHPSYLWLDISQLKNNKRTILGSAAEKRHEMTVRCKRRQDRRQSRNEIRIGNIVVAAPFHLDRLERRQRIADIDRTPDCGDGKDNHEQSKALSLSKKIHLYRSHS